MEKTKTTGKAKKTEEPELPPLEEAVEEAAAWKDTTSPVNSKASSDGRVMMGEDIEIYPHRRRDDLAGHGTQVFEAKDRRLVGDHIAVLCGRAAVPRVTSIGTYRHIKSPNILRLIEAGIIDWKPENRQRFAFIFEKPPQKKLQQTPEDKPIHFAEDRIMPALIQPILSVLTELRNADLVHGAVNPQNIFLAGFEGAETAQLGECLSTAPSMRQHPLFEPLERSMAQPSGRGGGTPKDDLYAFGMCVAMAARGQNLLAGRSPEQIIHDKLAEGSYSLVIGRERLPAGISEFLRGVLNDDETQRWDIDEAVRWLEGRRLSPKQPRGRLRAARPFVFKDEKFWDLSALANSFALNVAEAAVVIEQDPFDLWIKRNFEDKALLKRLESVVEKEKESTRDRLVTSACMALDPTAPVRYKGLSLFPLGFGNALADAMAREEDIQVYGEIVAQQLFNNWINLRPDEIPESSTISALFEKCRNYLTQKISGYGIERVLYTLNRECACMSPLVKDYFVVTPGSLLSALERISRRPDRPEHVLDRHMVAFVSVRESKMIDAYLGHITSPDPGNQVLGIIRTLAAIQKRFNTGPLPGLSAWMAQLGATAIDRFYDRDLRAEIKKRLEKVKDAGNLTALLDLLADARVIQEDLQRFAQAQIEYVALGREKEQIESYLSRRRLFGYATGRQVAMLVSALLAVLCIGGYLLVYFIRGMH